MNDDDEAEDPGPMPQLEDMDPRVSALRAQLEAADREAAQSRAVRKQKDDALQILQARATEEVNKARDKEAADVAVRWALLALVKIERTKSVEAAPEPETLSSPRSVMMPPYAAQRLNAAPVTLDLAWRGDANVDDVPPPLVEAEPKPSDVESVVAATGNDDDDKPIVKDIVAATDDDDVPVVVEDVVAATGGHKTAHDCQEQPVVETGVADAKTGGGADDGGADADAHGVDVQGADVEMEGADAKEGGGEEVDPEAMEEEDDDDTISCVETGVEAGVVEARVVDDVEVRNVDDVVVGATAGAVEGDGNVVVNAASASAIVRFTAGPLHVSTSALDEVLDVGDPVVAHYGHGLVEGKTVVRKAKELWSKGVVKAVHRVSSRRVTYDILYDDCGTCETGVLASNVRRRSADGCPGHGRPLTSPRAGLDLVEPVPTNAPGHLVESSTTFEVPTAPPPPLITAPTEELTEICTICHHEVSVDCDVVLKCGHVFHMSCLGEYSKHCGHAPTRRSFQVPCANCRVVDRIELGTNPRGPQRYNPQEEAERPQLATKKRAAAAAAPKSKKKKKKAQPRTAVVVDENYKPTQVVEPLWHPSGCDLCSRPLVLSAGRVVVIGWLPAAESGFLDIHGEPAALYKACFTSGHRTGESFNLEEYEVRKYLAPEACPSADDCVALMTVGSGCGDDRIRWTTEFGGEGSGTGVNAFANHVLLLPEAVSPPTRDTLLGRWIEVYWAGDKVWYKGCVVGKKTIIGGSVQLISVKYVDGEQHDEELQDEPFAGDCDPPDDRKPWYWRFAKQPNEAALPDESADVPPPPEFQLCRELSEVCESVETSSSVETPPRAATPKRSLPVTFRLGDDAKKPKTDVDGEAEDAEFEFEENQKNAMVLELLAAVAASLRGL